MVYIDIYYETKNRFPYATEKELRNIAYARWKGRGDEEHKLVMELKSKLSPPKKFVARRRNVLARKRNETTSGRYKDRILTPHEKKNIKKLNKSEHSSYAEHLKRQNGKRCWVKRILYTPM